MTIMDAIFRIGELKPNSYSQSEKIKWLSTLDGIIKTEIIDTHEGGENIEFNGYDENTELGTKLLVSAPYDEMYLFFMESKIDYWNGELGKYNNSINMFNTIYAEYKKHYNRTHMPNGRQFKYFDIPKTPEYQVANAVANVSIEED